MSAVMEEMDTRSRRSSSRRSKSRRRSAKVEITEEEEQQEEHVEQLQQEEDNMEQEQQEGEEGNEGENEEEHEEQEQKEEEQEEQQEEQQEQCEEQQEEQQEQGRSKKRSRKDRIKKRKLGHEAVITEAERRVLRQNQRKLFEKIQIGGDDSENDGNEDTEEDTDSETERNKNVFKSLNGLRQKNNALFDKVAYTREAVLDGDNLDELTKKFSNKVESMVQVPRYDPLRLVQKLRQKCNTNDSSSSSYFDWSNLGTEVGVCYAAIPSRVCFLSGPLADQNCSDDTLKRKKALRLEQQQERRKRKNENNESDKEEEEPEEVKNNVKDADQLSAAERAMNLLKKKLKKRCDETNVRKKAKLDEFLQENPNDKDLQKAVKDYYSYYGSHVDAIQFLFNPKSFTQTVENIFNFSFLIKKGEANILTSHKMKNQKNNRNIPPLSVANKIDENDDPSGRKDGVANGGLFIRSITKNEEQPVARQAVISFTMKDWRNLIEAYDIQKGDLPHRKGSKISPHSKPTSSQDDD